ncbi:MAG: hypothetical protein HY763_00470 [Planctomycetes bacterium]|nr:hypothetical protein [Planctomycetota bacterium]
MRHHNTLLRVLGVVIVAAALPRAAAQEAGSPADALPDGTSKVRVSDRGRVQLHVADLPLAEVLKLLSVHGKRNIIASPEVKGSVTANLYDVTFEEALDAVLIPNGAGYRSSGNFIYVYTLAQLAEMAARAAERSQTRVFRLSYLSGRDALTYLMPLLGDEKERVGTITPSPLPATGIGSGSDDGGGDASTAQDFILVTAPPEKMREIERLLKELDVRPKQVLIEATILRAELKDENALGIDFTIVGGVDLEKLGATSSGIQNVTLGELPQDRLERFNASAITSFTKDVPGGGITVGVIKDQVAIFLRALEQVTDTTVLANPKVLALNKQKGQVIVGRRDGFLTTTVTETQAVQTVEFLETGTQLIFRPFIGDDGFVRVELHPEDSVGFVNAQGLPSEQTTEVTTNVIVRDGDTILIGGLFREVATDARNQVPALGSIPGLGNFFRSKNDTTAREEVIILLTVHVVKDHAEYARQSEEQWENVERLRVGLRQGMMWHGRERLAESHYQRACASYASGNERKALWHVNLALHNNGRLLPAIQMREKLLRRRAWDEEGANTRAFIYRLIARERGIDAAYFARPGPPFSGGSVPPTTPGSKAQAGESGTN